MKSKCMYVRVCVCKFNVCAYRKRQILRFLKLVFLLCLYNLSLQDFKEIIALTVCSLDPAGR